MQRAEQKLGQEEPKPAAEDGMAALERQAAAAAPPPLPVAASGTRTLGFVSAGIDSQISSRPVVNAEEIELPEDEEVSGEEEEESTEKVVISMKAVPDAVFGDLARVEEEMSAPAVNGANAPMGALERIKRQRRQ